MGFRNLVLVGTAATNTQDPKPNSQLGVVGLRRETVIVSGRTLGKAAAEGESPVRENNFRF